MTLRLFCLRRDSCFYLCQWRAFFYFEETFFYLARLFLFGATFFNRRNFFSVRRNFFFTMARLFAVAHFLIAGSNTCVKQYFSNMAKIAVEVENDLEKASI